MYLLTDTRGANCKRGRRFVIGGGVDSLRDKEDTCGYLAWLLPGVWLAHEAARVLRFALKMLAD